MEQAYFERVTRQTQVRRLLQKAVLNLCQKNYAECAPNLEVDGIICISFPDSPDQHVVKIHEKIQLSESRIQTSCDKLQNETFLSRVQKSTDTGLFENEQVTMVTKNDLNGVVEDKDRMQNSYFDEGHAFSTHFNSSSNPVFPKMVPVSSQNNKILDSESHSTKSKRKMFKVVQRKRTTPDEPEILSDSDNEMPGSTNTSENPNTNSNLYECNPCQDKNDSDVKLPSNIKKTNVCESVEDGYVIVKVENFDDDVAVHEKSEPTSSLYDKNKAEFNCETQRFRQWIQLPSHDDREEPSQNRESLITIDGRVPEHSEDYIKRNYFSRIEEENQLTDKDTGNYQVRGSVGQIDLSQSKDYQHDSFNYPPKDIEMNSTPRFPSHHALFSQSLIHKNRQSQSKGSKTLDNLFINKCAEDLQSKLNRNKTSNTTDMLKQNEKSVSMIDLHSTSNDLTDSKLPDALSVSLNRLISTHAAKEKKYFCRHCGKGFTLKCTRSRHEKTICGGGGEGQYRCHICMKVFTRSDSRCRHLWKTHGVKSTSEVSPVC